ncbi:MAG TPA: arabinofuranosidase catalytic domain-containing protein [Polyangiaceae bacterium]|nr:arabinofuranosidase catalytic domain-containing protein [Polyangiaceae bacterium]
MHRISYLVPVALGGSLVASFGASMAACGSYSAPDAGKSGSPATSMAGSSSSGGSGSVADGGSTSSTASAGTAPSLNCATGTVECNGVCVDATTSTTCGSCGNTCPANQTCQAGSCTCAPGDTACVPYVAAVCDLMAASGHPCVSAHSTVRKLLNSYTGPLYQLCKGSFAPGPASCTSGVTMDIGTVAGGYADAAAQDTFCEGGTCTISIIYDQSPMKNDLKPAPKGGNKSTPDNPAKANDLPTKINGHSTYGVLIKPGIGYRILQTQGIATGDQPESMYMISSQQNLINGCCFDYGNAETSANDDGNGTMEAVYLGMGVVWGTGVMGGPWVMADLENGLYAGWENRDGVKTDKMISTNTPLTYDFVTAVVVGDVATANSGKGRFALYGGNATSGTLKTMYDGIRPEKPGYVPMQKQGSIILGIGGDNSNAAGGRFYEGVMTNGTWSKATVDALQANVVAAKYGQ